MKKIILIAALILCSVVGYSQDLAFSYNQSGTHWEGRSTSDSYILGSGNVVCEFDASFSNGTNGTVIMYVYNPSRQGFIPATYYIYPNSTFDLVANGYVVAKGRWSVINTGDGTGFKSKPCTYIVGCDCTGFKASGTYAPEKFICKKCGHHKDYHH
jgi:hypothetical protein